MFQNISQDLASFSVRLFNGHTTRCEFLQIVICDFFDHVSHDHLELEKGVT